MTTANPPTKTEQAYQTLRREILESRLPPGFPLRLEAIRDAYGFGWTPLREALSRLEAERLVTASANRGYAVAPVSLAELSDLTEMRRLIELPLLADSIAHGDEAWEAALVTAHYRLSRCPPPVEKPEDLAVTDWEQRHEDFHEALIAAGRSPWARHFYHQIKNQLRRHHRALSIAPGLSELREDERHASPAMAALRQALALAPHTELMEAALDRDIDRASALLAAHIELTKQVFVATNPDEAP